MSRNSGIKRIISGPVKAALNRLTGRQATAQPFLEHRYAARHRAINDAAAAILKQSIRSNYHTGWRARENYSAEGYEKDLQDHLFRRLESDRKELVPWLDSVHPLDNSKILEIGCGTGSSTLALAEQGASVTGIDIDTGALHVAHDRCKAYGVTADIRTMNAVEIASAFKDTSFDFIIFFACLEHMTLDERLEALAQAWSMLKAGGLLGVIETPNRLWYFDQHTSFLPFFQWLPDDLAFRYSRFSQREYFHDLYREWNDVQAEHFLRRGRGVSYHEFDLSLRPVQNLTMAESLMEFRAKKRNLRQNPTETAYKKILHQQCPAIPMFFLEKQLDFVVRKD